MKKNIRVLGIIPARGGSKRVPGKNIARVAGKPLIEYTIRAAKESKVLDAFIVSTDNSKIAKVAESLGADVPFLRPKKFSGDRSRDIGYAKHALEWLREHRGWEPEIIVLLPPDTPLKTSKDIDGVVKFLIDHDLDSVRTVAGPVTHPPFKAMWMMEKKGGTKMIPMFPQFVGMPSQELPPYYLSIGLAYATRARFIHRGTLWGPKVGGFVVDQKRALEIDEKEHLRQAEEVLRKRKR